MQDRRVSEWDAGFILFNTKNGDIVIVTTDSTTLAM